MANDFLHPVSYHLRDFGQYMTLDLPASDLGNMTLLGANAVGKTTLANCWFPLLIDGSIASPSFNPARSSDAIAQSPRPRNTSRDKRTFNSMLLGWGASAFKIRTGYTYVTLGSSKRTIVLGIGAHRQSDGVKSQTWWFVLTSADAANLVCIDDAGHGLNEQSFVEANTRFGNELHVFNRWEDYRGFVAAEVYGFDSGDTLGRLANAYRLLASPILTGGNARFTPIPNALREAQEPIDREQIIRPLAESQRQLNQSLALQRRLKDGQHRLNRIQTELFWGNLNLMAGSRLRQHVKQATARDNAQDAMIKATADVKRFDGQLKLLDEQLQSAGESLRETQQQLNNQQSLETTRQFIDEQIAELHKQQARYQQQQQELIQYRQEFAVVKNQLSQLMAAAAQLRDKTMQPLTAQLYTQSASLKELAHAIAQTQETQVLTEFAKYIKTKRQQVNDYQQLTAAIIRTGKDVAIVQDMQGQMGTAIDDYTSSVLAKGTNNNLHHANKEIHESGAAVMNATVAPLQKQQQDLLAAAPDLQIFLDDSNRLSTLCQLSQELNAVLAQLQDNASKQERMQIELKSAEKQVNLVLNAIDSTFDPDRAHTRIVELTQRRDALQIDSSLKQKVVNQQTVVNRLQNSISKMQNNRGTAAGVAVTQQENAENARDELGEIDARLKAALIVLGEYTPAETTLSSITELLSFVHSNQAIINQHPFADLGNKVRMLIDGRETTQSLDILFKERGEVDMAAALHENRTVMAAELMTVPFKLKQAESLINESIVALDKAVTERTSGQTVALNTYLNAAAMSISQQYAVIPEYNDMLTAGVDPDGIRLHITLQPLPGSTVKAVAEARDLQANTRPALAKLVQERISRLVTDPELADDDEAFMDRANELLDTRYWSEFVVTINRRHSDVEEVVNDAFVQSGGSGAEKAQAMVLPLLLVPKMRLRRAGKSDALRLVMFDEFADKLDPETAKAFAQTINRFGFNFIATMPSGAQTKILADGVTNRAYEVLAPNRKDGKFHANQVQEVLTWRAANNDD